MDPVHDHAPQMNIEKHYMGSYARINSVHDMGLQSRRTNVLVGKITGKRKERSTLRAEDRGGRG